MNKEYPYTEGARKVEEQLDMAEDGLTVSQLIARTGLSRIAPRILEIRRNGSFVETQIVKYKFLGMFPRQQAKYRKIRS